MDCSSGEAYKRAARIRREFLSGRTMREIGNALGLTRNRVHQILRASGVDTAEGGRAMRTAAITEKFIVLMDATGCGASEAARRLRLPVTRAVKEHARETRHERAVARFWSRVDKSGGPDACWPWTRYRGKTGYGWTSGVIDGERLAHRVAFILANDPTAAQVLHRCDNPPCCNPRHLYTGTPADNARDRDARGRSGSVGSSWNRGRRHSEDTRARMRESHRTWWAGLTPEQREAQALKIRDGVRAALAARRG